MGYLFSSCSGRKEQENNSSDESQPLLHDEADQNPKIDAEDPAKARRSLEHWSAIIAALSAGKFPSQDQLNRAIQSVLRSGLLDPDEGSQAAKALGVAQAISELGPGEDSGQGNNQSQLDKQLSDVILDVRGLLEVVSQFGLEKNGM